jgi:salicylate hydroxylase
MRIAIVGGGLGGLSAALFLRRAGIEDVVVFEQQPALQEIGAGIQIAPNAVRLLQRLGLGDALMDVAVPFEVAWEFRRWEDGRVLFEQRFGAEGETRYGAHYIAVHRADLLHLLADAIPAGVVELGRHVAGVDGSAVVFDDGSRAAFDAVIGADGIHSVVRTQIVGDESPEFTGLAAYRALVPAEEAPEFARRPVCSIWLGPHRHFVHYPVSGGRRINLVTANPAGDWREESWTAPGEVAHFLAEYEGWHEAVRSLIAAARETKRYAFYAREPVTCWVADRMALLGDAAHPMLPFFAQGAGQAIEDAAVLARCLAGVSAAEVPEALRRYEALRVERATRVQRMSGERREHHHMPDGPEQRARDERMATGSTDWAIKAVEWIYAHDASRL